ncbi:hypothetical protein BDR22DRAFT_833607 [Usnea florida]
MFATQAERRTPKSLTYTPFRSIKTVHTMRPSTAPRFPTALVFGILLATISAQVDALTLSDKQPINGFDAACTNAYNTPLTDCSNSDFAGQGCSNKCIGFLDSLQTTMMASCAGTSAYDNTLIGLFLAGQGVHTLCSNVPSGGTSSSGSGAGNGQSEAQAGASVIEDQSAVGDTSTSTTSTSTSISTTASTSTTSTSFAPVVVATSSTSTSSSPQAAATSSTTTVVPITVAPEPTTTSVAVVATTVMPASPADTSTGTSHTKSSTSTSSTSTSTDNGNGGGTPLDIGSSAACHGAGLSSWLFFFLAGSAGVIWLL